MVIDSSHHIGGSVLYVISDRSQIVQMNAFMKLYGYLRCPTEL